jgi:hypothetical protein
MLRVRFGTSNCDALVAHTFRRPHSRNEDGEECYKVTAYRSAEQQVQRTVAGNHAAELHCGLIAGGQVATATTERVCRKLEPGAQRSVRTGELEYVGKQSTGRYSMDEYIGKPRQAVVDHKSNVDQAATGRCSVETLLFGQDIVGLTMKEKDNAEMVEAEHIVGWPAAGKRMFVETVVE